MSTVPDIDEFDDFEAKAAMLAVKLPPSPKAITFDKWIFPIIRNTPQGNLIEELMAAQPLPQPVPRLFYADFVRQTEDDGVGRLDVTATARVALVQDAVHVEMTPAVLKSFIEYLNAHLVRTAHLAGLPSNALVRG